MKRYHILVVDDEETTLRSMAMALEKAGYEVSEAPDGTAALEKVKEAQAGESQFDLLVSDIGLPTISGLELLSRIEDMGIHLPSLIITGQVDEELVTRLEEKGGLVLPKPFPGSHLLELVEQVLGGSASGSEEQQQ